MEMFIAVTDRWRNPAIGDYPYVLLRKNNWDDYGFQTLFEAELHISGDSSVELGGVKILQRGQESGPVRILSRLSSLGESFCSLGQELDYYQRVHELPRHLRDDYLRTMRDIANSPDIEDQFKDETGYRTSLLRYNRASFALEEGRRLLRGEPQDNRTGLLSFRLHNPKPGFLRSLRFDFDDSQELPGRINVVIGYNGSGKTRLLADLAVAASGFWRHLSQVPAYLSGEDTNFGAVIAVSYSAFDTFETPTRQEIESDILISENPEGRTDAFGYVYCGLRRAAIDPWAVSDYAPRSQEGNEFELKSIRDMEKEFEVAHSAAIKKRRVHAYFAAMRTLSEEPSFGRIGVKPSDMVEFDYTDEALEAFRDLSTGHKIVVHIVTQLAAHLRPRSLVLLDEPECHLHPPLIAALLKAIQELLASYDSFAVVATHSPVVLQEVPAERVTVLERFAGESSAREPEVETFGAGVAVITREIFSLSSSSTDYQEILRSLAERYSASEIDAMFQYGASAQALALVRSYQAKRRQQ